MDPTPNVKTQDVYLTVPQVRARYGGVTARTIDRWIADEKLGFPRPVHINTRRYFVLAEVDAGCIHARPSRADHIGGGPKQRTGGLLGI
jgi:predicted DNA-binding transcriptional regulator AlpA